MQLPPHDVKGFADVHCTSAATNAYIPQQKKNKCNKHSYQKHNNYYPQGANFSKYTSRGNQSRNLHHILSALEGHQQSYPRREDL